MQFCLLYITDLTHLSDGDYKMWLHGTTVYGGDDGKPRVRFEHESFLSFPGVSIELKRKTGPLLIDCSFDANQVLYFQISANGVRQEGQATNGHAYAVVPASPSGFYFDLIDKQRQGWEFLSCELTPMG